jgi:hypothetical protein
MCYAFLCLSWGLGVENTLRFASWPGCRKRNSAAKRARRGVFFVIRFFALPLRSKAFAYLL